VAGWQAVGFWHRVEADRLAVVTLTVQRDQALATNAANAAEYARREAQHARAAAEADQAAAAAKSRAAVSASALKELSHAKPSGCSVSPAVADAVARLRK
jgi:hypothetical protein